MSAGAVLVAGADSTVSVGFLALSIPPLRRLRTGLAVRAQSAAELLLGVAMAAMTSPLGGPVPAAGWQAILLGVTVWFAAASCRGSRAPGQARRSACAHLALSAGAMVVMLSAMGHPGGAHSPWLTMSAMASPNLTWRVVEWTLAAWFAVDAARAAVRLTRRPPARLDLLCRGGMSLGMVYMLALA